MRKHNRAQPERKRTNVLVLLGILVIALYSKVTAQNLTLGYGTEIGGNGARVFDAAVDDEGNLYTTGLDFEEPTTTGGSNTPVYAVYLNKLSASGVPLWTQSLEGGAFNVGTDIALDAQGNIYHGGYFSGTVDFDPGPGVYELTSLEDVDYFVRKLNAAGDFVWARRFVGGPVEALTAPPPPTYGGYDMAVDPEGNLFVAGVLRGTEDLDPGRYVFEQTNEEYGAVFVEKFSPAGSLLWVNTVEGTDYAAPRAIALDGVGDVYMLGHFSGTIDLAPEGVDGVLTSSGDYDLFIQKMNQDGQYIWGRRLGGDEPLGEEGTALAVDCLGGVYTTGYFSGSIDFDPGEGTTERVSGVYRSAFIQKLSAEGEFLWVQSIDGEVGAIGEDIVVDSSGSSYTVGVVSSDGELFNATRTLFVRKVQQDGALLWHEAVGTSYFLRETRIALDRRKSMYLTGYYRDNANFSVDGISIDVSTVDAYGSYALRLDQANDVEDVLCGVNPASSPSSLSAIALALARGLDFVDANGSKTLSFEEAIRILPRMAEEQFGEIDSDGNGELNEQELVALVPPGSLVLPNAAEGEGEGEGPIRPSIGCPPSVSTIKDVVKNGAGDFFLLGVTVLVLVGLCRI